MSVTDLIIDERSADIGDFLVGRYLPFRKKRMVGPFIFIFGGEPLPEKRYIAWNFVSSELEKINQAKEDWVNKKFPKIDGDDTYIPLPD